MGFDLKEIEDQIQRLQDIKRLLSDPESAALLEKLLLAKGNGASGNNKTAIPERETPFVGQRAKEVERSNVDAVRAMISTMSGQFAASEVAEKLRRDGVAIENVQASKALRQLAGTGEVTPHPGPGAPIPTKYSKTDKLKIRKL